MHIQISDCADAFVTIRDAEGWRAVDLTSERGESVIGCEANDTRRNRFCNVAAQCVLAWRRFCRRTIRNASRRSSTSRRCSCLCNCSRISLGIGTLSGARRPSGVHVDSAVRVAVSRGWRRRYSRNNQDDNANPTIAPTNNPMMTATSAPRSYPVNTSIGAQSNRRHGVLQ
jgi:hypothetical protein